MLVYSTAGMVIGGVAGGIKGANIALPDDKAVAVEKLINNYLNSEDIPTNLFNQFNRLQNGRWQIVDSETDIVVTLGVENLLFTQFSDEELAISLTSSLVVSYGPESTDVTKRILLNSETEKYHVDHWIANSGANLKTGLDAAFEENSHQVIDVLSQFVGKKHHKADIFGWGK